jgi:hypothetical protein
MVQPLGLVVGLGLFLAGGVSALAADGAHWPVDGRIVGQDGEKSRDVSGLACSRESGFPRHCLVIDDNRQAAQRVTLHDGRLEAGADVPLIANAYHGKPLDLDGEGIAFAETNGRRFFYVIGSHGHPRDYRRQLDPVRDKDAIAARIASASQIIRLEEKPDGTLAPAGPVASLADIMKSVPALAPFAGQRLERDGATIEGVAVIGDQLYAGFRAPTFDRAKPDAAFGEAPLARPDAVILSVPLAKLFDGGEGAAKPAFVRLGDHQGVRDLAPYRNGLLILSGPATEQDGEYSVFWWDLTSPDPIHLPALQSGLGERGRKAEAILPLDATPGRLRVLVMFDGGKEGEPTPVELRTPW